MVVYACIPRSIVQLKCHEVKRCKLDRKSKTYFTIFLPGGIVRTCIGVGDSAKERKTFFLLVGLSGTGPAVGCLSCISVMVLKRRGVPATESGVFVDGSEVLVRVTMCYL